MIKEALQYIVSLSAPTVQEIKGQTYSDKNLHRVSYVPMAESINLSTLESLVDYIRSGVDAMPHMFIHIVSPTRVEMFSGLNKDRDREPIAVVNANIPAFNFGQFLDHETFCIALQSKFQDTEDRKLLLKFSGTVETGTVAEYGDDGVTQKATVRTGIASKGDAIVPNPVTLTAYRTFLEVEQVPVQYIFRMRDGRGVECALFEADGGAWKMEAMSRIKNYLEDSLDGIPGFTVIC